MTISTCSFVHKTLQNLHLNTRSALTFHSNGEFAGTLRSKNLIIFASLGLTRFSERRDVKSITKGRCVRMLVGLLSKRFGKIIRIWSLFSAQHGPGGENFGQTLKLKSNTSHVYKSLLGRLSKQNTFYGERTQVKQSIARMRGDRKYDDVGGSLKNGFSLINSIWICRDTNLIVNTISQCFWWWYAGRDLLSLPGSAFVRRGSWFRIFGRVQTCKKSLKCFELLDQALVLRFIKKIFFILIHNLALFSKTPTECPKSSPTSSDAANRFIHHLACISVSTESHPLAAREVKNYIN